MKLMNRTSLVAVATSVALTSGALAAPAMAQSSDASAASDTTVSTVDASSDTTADASTSSNIVSFVDTLATSSKDLTESDAFKWFSVVAAVVSTAVTAYTFITRIQQYL